MAFAGLVFDQRTLRDEHASEPSLGAAAARATLEAPEAGEAT
jgi:hypothetical protein